MNDDVDVDQGRRQALSAAGKALTFGLGVVGAGAAATVVSAGHAEETPDSVADPVFDETLLERYKPSLITNDLHVEPSSIHGFVVRSSEDETTALTYWVEYPVQLDATGYASHIGDHEPFFVFVANEGTADEQIDRVIYSGYHWLAAESRDPPTVDDGTRPRAYVVPQYHHYSIEQAAVDDRPGDDVELKDLTGSLPRWLDDEDFHEALSEDWRDQGSPAYNPWIMDDKASWWRESGLTKYEIWIRSAWLFLGIRGADGADIE